MFWTVADVLDAADGTDVRKKKHKPTLGLSPIKMGPLMPDKKKPKSKKKKSKKSGKTHRRKR